MAAVESIDRNLMAEDAAYAESMGASQSSEASDEMRIMAAGDVTINQEPNVPATAPAIQQPSAVTSTLGKAAIAAALLGTGAAGGVAIPLAMGLFEKPPAAEVPIDTDTTTQIVIE